MSDQPEHLGHILWRRRQEEREAQRRAALNGAANVTPLDPARHSRYAERALSLELDAVTQAAEGTRNDTLNAAAYSIAQLVAAGALDEHDTFDALRAAALSSGLTAAETDKTLRSAFTAGKQQPRALPDTTASGPREAAAQEPPVEPPVEPPSDVELANFWNKRGLLTHIQTYARARRTSPWAVLGCVLARIVAVTPPTVVLPPLIGGHASLNLFVGLVGNSGSGKGAAERVAAECITLDEHITTVTTGSGEGISHAYVKRTRGGELDQHTTAVLFSVPEIDTLSALGARQGATLMPELRRGWSGEQLGFAYADPTKRLTVEAHRYRMCLVAGIQPGRARTLLDDTDGGTPQRFIWCTAVDRAAPDEPPDAPTPWRWQRPNFSRAELRDVFTGRYELNVCETARRVVDDTRLARVRGDGDALDGHLLLAQLKIAAALAIADGRLDVSDDDWALASIIVKQSNATRASVAQTLAETFSQRNRARAEGEADRAMIVDEKLHEAQIRRASRAVLRHLRKPDVESAARGELHRAVQHRDREGFDEAVEMLLKTGQIVAVEAQQGERYALA